MCIRKSEGLGVREILKRGFSRKVSKKLETPLRVWGGSSEVPSG